MIGRDIDSLAVIGRDWDYVDERRGRVEIHVSIPEGTEEVHMSFEGTKHWRYYSMPLSAFRQLMSVIPPEEG